MADEDKPDDVQEGTGEPSLIVWLAILGVLTIVAAGAGSVLALMMAPDKAAVVEPDKTEEGEVEKKPSYSSGEHVAVLPPIITNLVAPRGTFIRLEGAVVFKSAPEGGDEVLIREISGDILGLLHTMTLAQIEGASGLQHLREDLSSRAMIRSEGLAKEVILHSLVVE